MNLTTLASDGSTVNMLPKVVSFTLFYATLVYLPLRIGVVLLAKVHDLAEDQRKLNRPIRPNPTRYIID